MSLVDDAHGHEQHPRAHVEPARDQKVEIGLLDLELAALLEPLDHGVLDLDLTDEAESRTELVREEQDEPVKVEYAVPKFQLVEMELHVARERRDGRWRGTLSDGRLAAHRRPCEEQAEGEAGEDVRNGSKSSGTPIILTHQNIEIEAPKSHPVKRAPKPPKRRLRSTLPWIPSPPARSPP